MRSSCSSVVGPRSGNAEEPTNLIDVCGRDGRYRRSYQGPFDTDAMTTGRWEDFLCAYHSGRDLPEPLWPEAQAQELTDQIRQSSKTLAGGVEHSHHVGPSSSHALISCASLHPARKRGQPSVETSNTSSTMGLALSPGMLTAV